MTCGNAQKRRQRWLRYEWFRDPACRYCGRLTKLGSDDEPENDDLATCDHYVPVARGGIDHRSNWRLSCRKCNGEKGDQWPELWLLDGEVILTPPVPEVKPTTALEQALRAAGFQ